MLPTLKEGLLTAVSVALARSKYLKHIVIKFSLSSGHQAIYRHKDSSWHSYEDTPENTLLHRLHFHHGSKQHVTPWLTRCTYFLEILKAART